MFPRLVAAGAVGVVGAAAVAGDWQVERRSGYVVVDSEAVLVGMAVSAVRSGAVRAVQAVHAVIAVLAVTEEALAICLRV